MLNKQELLRGLTDTLILGQLYAKDSYGYEINKQIYQQSGSLFQLTEATLYTAFRRLETVQLVTSYWGNEEGGARRRYYSITEKGKKVYLENAGAWMQFKEAFQVCLPDIDQKN